MNTNKHTPGPWMVEFARNGLPYRVVAPNGDDQKPGAVGKNILRWGSISLPSSEEGLANARLIAASPCTHAAALPFIKDENRIRFMGEKDGRIYLSVTPEEYAALEAAISKATGQDQ